MRMTKHISIFQRIYQNLLAIKQRVALTAKTLKIKIALLPTWKVRQKA